jgi:hypothetical protein
MTPALYQYRAGVPYPLIKLEINTDKYVATLGYGFTLFINSAMFTL